MTKYKVCPGCGKHNDPSLMECPECETDLSGTRLIDEDMEKVQMSPKPSEKSNSVLLKMIRRCECGVKNPVQSRKCKGCGEDISMLVPTPDEEMMDTNRYIIESVDGTYAYELTRPATVVGRENEMSDYLKSKSYVSRKHAEFRIENDRLYVVNFSQTNYTYINNVKIDNALPKELIDGDEVGLGGNQQNGVRQNEAAYFVVKICSCS